MSISTTSTIPTQSIRYSRALFWLAGLHIFIIAISKSDMLDDELKEAISKELPKNIPHLFISSVTNTGLVELKDLLWKTLNAE